MGRPVIKVVAAVIERDGQILVGQRRKSDSHGLKWEFPGGKVERGESPLLLWRGNWKRNSGSRRAWDGRSSAIPRIPEARHYPADFLQRNRV